MSITRIPEVMSSRLCKKLEGYDFFIQFEFPENGINDFRLIDRRLEPAARLSATQSLVEAILLGNVTVAAQ
jgi:hypothetical protein